MTARERVCSFLCYPAQRERGLSLLVAPPVLYLCGPFHDWSLQSMYFTSCQTFWKRFCLSAWKKRRGNWIFMNIHSFITEHANESFDGMVCISLGYGFVRLEMQVGVTSRMKRMSLKWFVDLGLQIVSLHNGR